MVKKSLAFYRLSQEADCDLNSIFEYSEIEYGTDQAVNYLVEIEKLLDDLIHHPFSGKKRDEIKKGLFSFPKGEHIIFYRIMTDHIRVVRVLHGSRDIPSHFK
ncbi:MAG: type II toxin-antitoxin system RelE/ParE family toxin [Balneolaceae bacterium]|nr:MAG: type II toxin-antitoxin system RelE/ParE family toxin [Balneolaceae bacterium]